MKSDKKEEGSIKKFFNFFYKNKLLFRLVQFGERFHLDLLGYFIFLVILLIFFFNNSFSNYFGLFVLIVGFIIWIKGICDLKESFQITPDAKRLVTKGIYSKMKHPIYFGSFIVDVGLIIYSLNKWIVYPLIIYTLILSIVQIFRAKEEEKALEKKFRKSYINYKKQTWF